MHNPRGTIAYVLKSFPWLSEVSSVPHPSAWRIRLERREPLSFHRDITSKAKCDAQLT